MRRKRRFITPGIERQVSVARRHRDFDENLVWTVSSQHPALARVQATPESRKLYNLYSQVMLEFNRLTCYLRLSISPHGILHVEHTPEHRIEDLLVRHFLYRFPRYVIVLGSSRGTFIGRNSSVSRVEGPIENVLERLESELPLDPVLQELKATDDGNWEAFYQSQVVKERENPQLFLKNVPRRFLGMDSFREERRQFGGTAGLGRFMKVGEENHVI